MAKFKIIVSDPTEGTSKIVELEEARASPLIGKKIGEVIEGTVVDLAGQKVQVTGGSDKDGFPMRPSVHGGVRRRIVLAGGCGFNPTNEGMRRRKTIRGKRHNRRNRTNQHEDRGKARTDKRRKESQSKKEEDPSGRKRSQDRRNI